MAELLARANARARRAQLGAQAGPTLHTVIYGPSGTGTGTFTGTRVAHTLEDNLEWFRGL